jgi:predicted O-linked N-acetylglucosamine transferase (SPINDLY family)
MTMTTPDEAMAQALFHYSNGRLLETEGLCRQILDTDSRYAPALHLLGVLAYATGHADAAVDLVRRAIAVDAATAAYHSNLGVFLTARGDFDEAASACRSALALDPELAEVHYNLGNALQGTRELAGAAAAYRKALSIRPDYPHAHNNLGNVLKDMGELDDAAQAYGKALSQKPDYAHACSNLANALKDMGRQAEAIEMHRRAVEIGPSDPEIHSNLILSLHYAAHSDAALIVRESRRWNDRHAAPLRASVRHHDNERSPERPLRIGLVSADLRMHSVAFFLLPLVDALDKQNFHVTCFSTGGRADSVTERIRAASDAWCNLAGLSDDAAAQAIRQQRIDILIDLGGHTSNNRLPLFARKPAPCQMSYLGYPGGTGLAAIDGFLTDAVADPPSDEPAGVDRPIRLPVGAWCFAPLSGKPAVAALPAIGNGFVTFGSFNSLAKVTPQALSLWARVLQDVPASRLLLKSVAFRNAEIVSRFHRAFADRGIAAARVELVPDDSSQLRHLQQYDRVDVALDTFPYHGATTTCEALWMGVPVIALAGERHASRMGASLLTTAGHPEWVARSEEDYVQAAVDLAADLPRLSAVRAGLREQLQRSPLMDAPRFARSFEAACRARWREWCARPSSPPAH